MKWYAEINETGFCFHTTQNELPLSDTVLLADENVIGMTWDGEKWNEPEKVEVVDEPTEEELYQAEVLLMLTEILAKE